MKLTWFGGTTLRLHIGGRIIVADASRAPADVDARELQSGADMVFAFGIDVAAMPALDAQGWRPRRSSLLDGHGEKKEVRLWQAGPSAVLVDAPDEPPMLLAAGAVADAGRWSRDAVVVVLGPSGQISGLAADLLRDLAPRLLAVAAPEESAGGIVAELRERLAGTSLVALERGQALEV